jgi:GABA permease
MQTAERPAVAGRRHQESSFAKRAPATEMRVQITSFGAWMVGVGSIIGSMAWLLHGPMLARAGTLPCIAAWLIAAVTTLPLVLILMELSSMFPRAGGPYIYKYYALKRLIPAKGELVGFLTGWLFWMAAIVGLACMSCGLSNLLCSMFFGGTQSAPLWFGPAVILFLFGSTTLLNLLPVGKASKINNFFTLLKFAMALGFGFIVATSGHASPQRIMQVTNPSGGADFIANVGSVLMLAMAGFSFIEISGCTSAETENARKVVPKATLLTLITVSAIYIGMCVAVSASSDFVLSADKSTLVVPGTTVQATCPAIAGYLGGPLVGQVFAGCVIASIFGCAFIALLAVARVSYSMAKTELFPEQFGMLDPNTGVPRYALWFQFICLCTIGVGANLLSRTGAFADAYTFLGETFGFMYAFVAMLYGVCLVSLRYTDAGMERAFRIGKRGNALAWLLASITVAIWGFCAFFCVQWTHQLAGILILLSGVPIYKFYSNKRAQPIESHYCSSGACCAGGGI